MAGNITIPQELTKVVTVEVKDTSDTLRKFLTDLLIRVNDLETRIKVLENGS